MPEEKNVNAQGERSIALGDFATDNKIYSGDDLSIKIERDVFSSAIISGNGNKVVIYQQYQSSERQVQLEKTSDLGEIGPNPYKGLLAFHEEDGNRYFGRELQIEKLWNRFRTLHENIEAPLRLLPILGPSGSGKSSLARAGLIPELARRSLPGKSQVRVAVLVPGTHPVEALATVLARVATNDPIPVAKTREFTEELKKINQTTNIYDGLRLIATLLPEITISPLVVLVDQFEEIYSLCGDKEERQIFIDNLIHAASDRAGAVSVIITLRSDFLGATQRHPALNQLIAKEGVIIPAMSEEELRRAITKPAELAGHPLDEAVVSVLLKDTQGREGALPLLQFALTQIWDGLQKGIEPVKTLNNIGGVGGALAESAQHIFDNLNDEEKKIARQVFLGLVQLGEGASDTRRRAHVDSLVSYKTQPEDVKRVIDRFASPGVRLVTLSTVDGKETAEVTHEALFANWGQMKEWLDSGRSDIRFQRRLEEAAGYWNQHGRPDGSLWRSPDLDSLKNYYQQANDNMTALQVDFFQASKQAENNRRWLFRALTAGLGAGLAIAITATGIAVYQWQSAEREKIEQTAIAAKNQLSTYPVKSLVTAISLVGQSQNPFLNFPNQSFPQSIKDSIKDSLFSAVEISREKNLLKGHQGSVNSVAISRDGQTIVSGGKDGTVRLWNRQGQPLSVPFQGHHGSVNSVAISMDGQIIVSGGEDGTVRLWNCQGQPLSVPFQGHHGSVNSVAISADGQTIVSGGEDGTIRLWNRQGQPLGVPFQGQHHGFVGPVAISADGQTIVSGGEDGTVRLWNRQGQPLGVLLKSPHIIIISGSDGDEVIGQFVNSVAISIDERTILSGGKDGVRLWNRQGQSLGKPFQGHQGSVMSVAISADGQTIVSGGEDGTVRLWNRQGQLLSVPFQGHHGSVNSVAISADGQTIVSGGEDGTVRLWNRQGQPLSVPFQGHQDSVNSVAISTDGQTIVSGGEDGVRLWNRQGQPLGKPFQDDQNFVMSVAISADGQTIVSGGEDGTVRLWNRQGQPLGKPFKGHQDFVMSVVISTDGQTIVSGGADSIVRLWNRQGQPLGEPFQDHQDSVIPVVISRHGQTIVSGGEDGILRLWNRQGQRLRVPFQGQHQSPVIPIAISTDGQTIVTGSTDGTVRLWNRQGQPLGKPFQGHQDSVNSVAISTDRQTIVSGGTDGTVRLWNRQGQPLGEPFQGHQDSVNSVVISRDGQTIVSGGEDGTIRLWNRQGQPLGEPFQGYQGIVNSVAISTDGQTIVSGGAYGIRLWDIRLDTWLKAGCERLKDHPVFTQPESADEKEAKATCQPYLR